MKRTSTQRMLIAALVEAPSGLGSSLARWLQARTGCSGPTAYKYSRIRTGLLPKTERDRYIREAVAKRAAELEANVDTNATPPQCIERLQAAEEESSYAAENSL